MEFSRTRGNVWSMILAGGEGVRLRPLTRLIVGDERPKQFCRIVGGRTLLDETRYRAMLLTPPSRTAIVLTRAHSRFFASLTDDVPSRCLIVQPGSRGTAPAILYGLLRIEALAPSGTVVILPSDHYVSDDFAFMRHVAIACAAVTERSDLVILLGVPPTSAEADYGWIQPGDLLPIGGLQRVRRFWEKPNEAHARALRDRGCLWSTFTMVARVPTLLDVTRRAMPALWRAFEEVDATVGTSAERHVMEQLYRGIGETNFSHEVLTTNPSDLAVLAMRDVEWTDLGEPHRVLATLARLGITPDGAMRLSA